MSPIPVHDIGPSHQAKVTVQIQMDTVSGLEVGAEKVDDDTKSKVLGPNCVKRVNEEVVDLDGSSFSYSIFLPDVPFPASYKAGWCPSALKFLLDSFDEEQCEEVLRTYESCDWRKEAEDGDRSSKYFHLIRDNFEILPALDLRGKSKAIERLLKTAKAAYMASPRLFIIAYFTLLQIFLPNGFVARYGYIDYTFCPIQRYYHCYSIRVLRYRYPFCCIPIHDSMLEKVEDCVLSISLDQHKNEYDESGMNLPVRMRKILSESSSQ